MTFRYRWILSVYVIVMALAAALLLICVLQGAAVAQPSNVSLWEFDWKASGVVEEARIQLVILVNQLMTNATIITQVAEGNASWLLANLYNEINSGIADAQVKASQIGATFQNNLSKKVDEVMRQAGAIYNQVEASLRNSTVTMEETAMRLLRTSEEQLARVVSTARAGLAGGSAPVADSPTTDKPEDP